MKASLAQPWFDGFVRGDEVVVVLQEHPQLQPQLEPAAGTCFGSTHCMLWVVSCLYAVTVAHVILLHFCTGPLLFATHVLADLEQHLVHRRVAVDVGIVSYLMLRLFCICSSLACSCFDAEIVSSVFGEVIKRVQKSS